MATLSSLVLPGDVLTDANTATLTNKTIGDDLKFADSDESNWVALQAASTVASNVTWTLPSADGTSGQVLSTDGSGTLSWASGGGGGSSISAGDSSVAVTDAGTGKVEVTVDNVEVADFTTGEIVFNETGANQDFRVEGDTNANLIVADAGVDKVGIGTNTFNTNGGVLQVSNGISFPATQSACSDANTLDDYEEGTFTPVFADAATGGNVAPSYAAQNGRYTKIGRMVYFFLQVQNVSTSGMTGGNAIFLRGLPFTSKNLTAVAYAAPAKINNLTFQSGYTQNHAIVQPNSTYAQLQSLGSGVNTFAPTVNQITSGANTIDINGQYEVN